MLRIWSGPEMEGNHLGIITLFVCSTDKIKFNTFFKFLNDEKITKIYLGAGREDFLGFETNEDFISFKEYCQLNNIQVTIETTLANFNNLYAYLDFAEIILSIRDTKVSVESDIKLKLDDYKTARIFSNEIYYDTDLSDVLDNKYSCDKLLLMVED